MPLLRRESENLKARPPKHTTFTNPYAWSFTGWLLLDIAYQQNVGPHPFEENEEQRYIKFVRCDVSSKHSIVTDSGEFSMMMPMFVVNESILASRT